MPFGEPVITSRKMEHDFGQYLQTALDNENDSNLEFVLEFYTKTLEERNATRLQAIMLSFASAAPKMKPKYQKFVAKVVGCFLTLEHEATSWDAFDEFLRRLCCTQTYYTPLVYQHLLKGFLPITSLRPVASQQDSFKSEGLMRSPSLNSVLGESERSPLTIAKIHQIIVNLVNLLPHSILNLCQKINDQFPAPYERTIKDMIPFTKHLLELTMVCPALRDSILECCIDKILQLDTKIVLEELPDTEEEELFFELDDARNNELEKIKISAEVLDFLMGLMFAYIDREFSEAHAAASDASDDRLIFFLEQFDAKLLRTHKSKFTQFLMFYVTKFKPVYAEQFVAYLLNKFLDHSNPQFIRSLCANYVGSYLSRALLVPQKLLKNSLGVLVTWVHEYLDRVGARAAADFKTHNLFYNVVQTILYIICFHSGVLFEGERGRDFFEKMDLARIVGSSLNPLMFCLATVVGEFSRICFYMKLNSCLDVIRRNQALSSIPAMADKVMLDSYFPFDPYLLRNSSKYINNIYRSWTGHVEEDSPEDSYARDLDEGFEERDSVEASHDDTGFDLASSLQGMSITPGVGIDVDFHFQQSLET